jgi:Ca2+-binding RTX toxin-like protein
LSGGAGGDILTGGLGRDVMTGGLGSDTFDFNLFRETGKSAATRDVILDFQHGFDHIDLSGLDAKGGVGGNQAFKFIAAQAFHHVKGELHYTKVNLGGTSHDKTIVEGDLNGDGKADFQIELKGLLALTKGDFIL